MNTNEQESAGMNVNERTGANHGRHGNGSARGA